METQSEGTWSKPVVRNLADQVADTILEQVARGQLRPGEALPAQRELARRLGVGLAVVREAIQRLQTLRILSSHQGRGTIVESVGWAQLMFEPSLGILALERHALAQIWEARNGIEKETARLAAERATEADLATLRRILAEAGEGVSSYEENQRLNRAFHTAIATASKNLVLAEILEPLLQIDLGMKRRVFDASLSRRSWESHRRIYDAIASRDEGRVARAMADHDSALSDELSKVDHLFDEEEARSRAATTAANQTPARAARL